MPLSFFEMGGTDDDEEYQNEALQRLQEVEDLFTSATGMVNNPHSSSPSLGLRHPLSPQSASYSQHQHRHGQVVFNSRFEALQGRQQHQHQHPQPFHFSPTHQPQVLPGPPVSAPPNTYPADPFSTHSTQSFPTSTTITRDNHVINRQLKPSSDGLFETSERGDPSQLVAHSNRFHRRTYNDIDIPTVPHGSSSDSSNKERPFYDDLHASGVYEEGHGINPTYFNLPNAASGLPGGDADPSMRPPQTNIQTGTVPTPISGMSNVYRRQTRHSSTVYAAPLSLFEPSFENTREDRNTGHEQSPFHSSTSISHTDHFHLTPTSTDTSLQRAPTHLFPSIDGSVHPRLKIEERDMAVERESEARGRKPHAVPMSLQRPSPSPGVPSSYIPVSASQPHHFPLESPVHTVGVWQLSPSNASNASNAIPLNSSEISTRLRHADHQHTQNNKRKHTIALKGTATRRYIPSVSSSPVADARLLLSMDGPPRHAYAPRVVVAQSVSHAITDISPARPLSLSPIHSAIASRPPSSKRKANAGVLVGKPRSQKKKSSPNSSSSSSRYSSEESNNDIGRGRKSKPTSSRGRRYSKKKIQPIPNVTPSLSSPNFVTLPCPFHSLEDRKDHALYTENEEKHPFSHIRMVCVAPGCPNERVSKKRSAFCALHLEKLREVNEEGGSLPQFILAVGVVLHFNNENEFVELYSLYLNECRSRLVLGWVTTKGHGSSAAHFGIPEGKVNHKKVLEIIGCTEERERDLLKDGWLAISFPLFSFRNSHPDEELAQEWDIFLSWLLHCPLRPPMWIIPSHEPLSVRFGNNRTIALNSRFRLVTFKSSVKAEGKESERTSGPPRSPTPLSVSRPDPSCTSPSSNATLTTSMNRVSVVEFSGPEWVFPFHLELFA